MIEIHRLPADDTADLFFVSYESIVDLTVRRDEHSPGTNKFTLDSKARPKLTALGVMGRWRIFGGALHSQWSMTYDDAAEMVTVEITWDDGVAAQDPIEFDVPYVGEKELEFEFAGRTLPLKLVVDVVK